MREIKFKVWAKHTKSMVSLAEALKEVTFGFLLKFNDTYDLLLYTGLKDKNGVEIYEGDVFKHNSGHWIVDFDKGSFILNHSELKNIDGSLLRWGSLSRLFDVDMNDIYNRVEVIGNIYENKELLDV